MRVIQSSPPGFAGATSRIMVVGEAPGADEARLGRPFVGMSGHELDTELQAAGLARADLFLTNVCHERPPGNEIEAFFSKKTTAKKEGLTELFGRYPRQPVLDGLVQLQADIDRLQPTLIIALGNTALWALTGLTGILKWRGSILPATGGPVDGRGIKLIPTLHPAAILREYVYRAVAIQDLRRALRESAFPDIRRPTWNFTVPTSLEEVRDWLNDHIFSQPDVEPVADVENFYETERVHDGRLICLGFASSTTDAICIPFVHRVGDNPHYWDTADEEAAVVSLCRQALTTRPITFHNCLHDRQIIARNWGFLPRMGDDTMVMQHTAFPGMIGGKIDPVTGKVSKKGSSLSLAFCSSMYCRYHRFWKDDGKGWDPDIHDEAVYWAYNCEDSVRTFECRTELRTILHQQKLWDQYLFEMELFEPVFKMMFRGINGDIDLRRRFGREIEKTADELQAWIDTAVGHSLNVGSAPQMQALFYNDFGLPPILHRKTRRPTLDDKALETFIKRKPILRPLIERIQTLRSLATFRENYIDFPVSRDGRFRYAFNVAGIETFRFSSNSTAFAEGRSMQNFPRPPDD